MYGMSFGASEVDTPRRVIERVAYDRATFDFGRQEYGWSLFRTAYDIFMFMGYLQRFTIVHYSDNSADLITMFFDLSDIQRSLIKPMFPAHYTVNFLSYESPQY